MFGSASDKITWLINDTWQRSRFCDFAARSSLSVFCRCGRWAEAHRTPSVRWDYFDFCAYKLSKLKSQTGLKPLPCVATLQLINYIIILCVLRMLCYGISEYPEPNIKIVQSIWFDKYGRDCPTYVRGH